MAIKQIPQMQAENREVNQLQNNILQILNPLIRQNPILAGTTLKNIKLSIGNNTINTNLNRTLQGWLLVRKRGPATDSDGNTVSNFSIYDQQDGVAPTISANPTPNSTLILNSNANISVDILVY